MENRNQVLFRGLVLAVGIIVLVCLGGFWWLSSASQHAAPTQPGTQSVSFVNAAAEPLSTATPNEIASTLGDTLFGYGYIVTVDDTDHSDIFNDQFVASQNHTMHAYHVVMESDSATGIEVNPRYWRLFDSQTPAYPEVFAGKDPALVTAKALTRGEKLQGWVTFEIPKGGNHFELAYDIPNLPVKASFVFDVG